MTACPCDKLHPCAEVVALWDVVAETHHAWAMTDDGLPRKREAYLVYSGALRRYNEHFDDRATVTAVQPSLGETP